MVERPTGEDRTRSIIVSASTPRVAESWSNVRKHEDRTLLATVDIRDRENATESWSDLRERVDRIRLEGAVDSVFAELDDARLALAELRSPPPRSRFPLRSGSLRRCPAERVHARCDDRPGGPNDERHDLDDQFHDGYRNAGLQRRPSVRRL